MAEMPPTITVPWNEYDSCFGFFGVLTLAFLLWNVGAGGQAMILVAGTAAFMAYQLGRVAGTVRQTRE